VSSRGRTLGRTARKRSEVSSQEGGPIRKAKKERMIMKFENDTGQMVEINFQTFEAVLRGAQFGLTPVKLKNGKQEWLKATEEEILEAAVEE
jgi:hypothetical protein